MGQVHEEAPNNWARKQNMESTLVNWGINYTDEDLHTHTKYGNGAYCWCQDVGNSTENHMIRGATGVSSSNLRISSGFCGFRPALILIP